MPRHNKSTGGAIQAQGGGYQDSEPWSQTYPPTVSDGLSMLDALVARMPRRERNKRKIAIVRASTWIVRVGAAGGVGPPGRSFLEPGARQGERIDVQINKGIAFVP